MIACLNKATVPLGVDFDKLIAALQVYVTKHIAPVWGTPATLVKATTIKKGQWAIVFLDDADVEGALAYHDLTPDGFPLSKVFVKTTLNNGEFVSAAAAHELIEMLVNAGLNLMYVGPDGTTMMAGEGADPVEALSFKINGIPMSDFVYPSYFEGFRKPRSVKFDHLGAIKKPFEILPGGYQIVFQDGQWGQVFGSKTKEQRFKKQDRRGRRSERICVQCRR